jgi:hypothetical protein
LSSLPSFVCANANGKMQSAIDDVNVRRSHVFKPVGNTCSALILKFSPRKAAVSSEYSTSGKKKHSTTKDTKCHEGEL